MSPFRFDLADGRRGVAVISPACPADFNNSGVVTVQDIFDFLSAWFALDPRADYNGGGMTTCSARAGVFNYFIINQAFGGSFTQVIAHSEVPGSSSFQAADRFSLDADPYRGSPLNPVNLGLRVLNAFDRRNDADPPTPEDSFLIIALKLRKPGGAA